MKKNLLPIAACIMCIWSAACSAGHAVWSGYPDTNLVYKFEIYTNAKDRWDSATKATPPLAPGKAAQAAKKFVRDVPLRPDMKEWNLQTIILNRMSSSPEEWVYVLHFDAVPKAEAWNGPVPWIDVPVQLDGTIPKPTISKQ